MSSAPFVVFHIVFHNMRKMLQLNDYITRFNKHRIISKSNNSKLFLDIKAVFRFIYALHKTFLVFPQVSVDYSIDGTKR